MRLAILLLLFSLLSQPLSAQFVLAGYNAGASATNTFTVVNNNTFFLCASTNSCSVTITSTGTGHLLTLMSVSIGGGAYATAVSGAGTWTCPTSTQNSDNTGNGGVSGCYNLSSTSGVTSLTVTFNVAATYRVVVNEYSFTLGSVNFDTASATGFNTLSAGTYPGVGLSLHNSSEIIEQWTESNATLTALSAPYTQTQFAAGAGWGTAINASSGAAPTWTVTSGGNNNPEAAMAFY